MKFLNSMEVEHLADKFGHGNAAYPLAGSPVHARACRFLLAYMGEVNNHSDGWAYWRAPLKAAQRLIAIVDNSALATEHHYKQALTLIKRFYTQRGYDAGMQWPEGSCKHCGAHGPLGEKCPDCRPSDGLGPMFYV